MYNTEMVRVVVGEPGHVAFPEEVLRLAELAPGQEVDVVLDGGFILIRPSEDDSDEDPAWLYSDKFVRGVEEAIADIEAGRSTFHASTEDFLASLRARESSEEVDVVLDGGSILIRPSEDDSDEDPEWLYTDEFLRGVDEAIADIEAGRSTFHASTDDFLAHLDSLTSRYADA